jgi:hypothetical protein
VRDFNETMPMVIPSSFTPNKGTVVISRPEDRLREAEAEEAAEAEAEAEAEEAAEAEAGSN